MARQVLENGVILPAEYSDDWYDDMTSNLTKLDDVIGSDSEKLSSADVGAAALSNSYNDLDNLPTIPTVNDATLTIQKNGVDVQTFTANSSSNVTANITVPTKTSDLTNDSNFVDTSNSAVASGITSAKVTSYDAHIADTDIHVTTADKSKWNNGVSQSYVLRYSSSSVTDNSTIAYSTLDNTDNIKASDKIIDVDGKIFSIVSVDTANQTVTVGSALIDLALDANVVHTAEINSSGIGIIEAVKEVGGVDFNTLTTQGLYGTNASGSTNNPVTSPCVVQVIKRLNSVIQIANVSSSAYKSRYIRYCADITAQPPVWQSWVKFATDDNVMHISGNESASGDKNFKGLISTIPDVTLWPTDTNTSADITSLGGSSIHLEYKASGKLTDLSGGAWSVVVLGEGCFFFRINNGTDIRYKHFPSNSVNRIPVVSGANRFINDVTPNQDNTYNLGSSSLRWSTINGLNPSSLSMPDTANGIDISSYITTGDTDSNYTPSVNGWIWIKLIGNGASIIQGDFGINSSYVTNNLTNEKWVETNLFVTKDVQATIRCRGITGIVGAKFYPCQGNV